jgi:tRNA 2-thiouridine synthesizing protein E
MPTREIAGKTVRVNDEGFMTDPTQWDRDIARVIAAEEGLSELTEAHWKLIDWIRETAKGNGWTSPTLRQITAGTATPTKQLFSLFPKAPAKKAARIAGLLKPAGCI